MRKIKQRLEQFTEGKSKVYIVPTKAGLKYIFINFTLFLISLSYTNNMALMITFLMVSYFILQMLESHNLILNTKIDNCIINDNFLKSNVAICHFKHKLKNENIKHLNVQFISTNSAKIDGGKILYKDEKIIKYDLNLKSRGFYNIKNIKLFTHGASKLFYVWRYFPIELEFYTYPEKKFTDIKQIHNDESNITTTSEAEFSDHIPYIHGLSSKRIDWKVYARKDLLFWKKHIDHISTTFEINYQSLSGEKEEKLNQMSYLIEKLFKEGTSWRIVLPNKILQTSHGKKHYKESLEVISDF